MVGNPSSEQKRIQPSTSSARWLTSDAHAKIEGDPLGINGFDHIEFFVGNGKQSAYFYMQAFGFAPIAYRGPETGVRDTASYVLQQGNVRFVITSPLSPRHASAHGIMMHSDYVHAVALEVENCQLFYQEALRRGARPVLPPRQLEDDQGSAVVAAIGTYGDVQHTIVERGAYRGPFLPGYRPYEEVFGPAPTIAPVGIEVIDHVVGNVELGKMNEWVSFYEKVLGFREMLHFTDAQISTEYSALMSKVMRNGTGSIKFPINEPAEGKRKSQIEEYLEFNLGPGVQHIALHTSNIIKTVRALRDRGVQFLSVPSAYYEEVPKRVGDIDEDLAQIRELGILVDRDPDGYLLQLFSKPVQDRPTLFFELIQRAGAQGFGEGNFKALFEALEREQAARGNL